MADPESIDRRIRGMKMSDSPKMQRPLDGPGSGRQERREGSSPYGLRRGGGGRSDSPSGGRSDSPSGGVYESNYTGSSRLSRSSPPPDGLGVQRQLLVSRAAGDDPGITCMDDGSGAVYVSALRSGGAAAQAGLLLGERVLSVNGVAAATHAQAIGALASPASRDHHTVVVSGRVREVAVPRAEAGALAVAPNKRGRGCVVTGDGGAAIKVGDVLLAAGGRLVASQNDLRQALDGGGASVSMCVWGRAEAVILTPSSDDLGVTLCDVEPTAEEAEVAAVQVLRLDDGGRFARAGVRAGDLLVSANGTVVTGHAQGLKVCERAKRDEVFLVVHRAQALRHLR